MFWFIDRPPDGINWNQVLAQVVTVLFGGLIVGFILAVQKDRLERKLQVARLTSESQQTEAQLLFDLHQMLMNFITLSYDASAAKQAVELPESTQSQLAEYAGLRAQLLHQLELSIQKAHMYQGLQKLGLQVFMSTVISSFQSKLAHALNDNPPHTDLAEHIAALQEDLESLFKWHKEMAEEALLGKSGTVSKPSLPYIGRIDHYMIKNQEVDGGSLNMSHLFEPQFSGYFKENL